MTTPNPQQAPLPPEQRLALEQQAQYERIKRNLAIGGVIICPLIALLPPRKLDLYTFALGLGFYGSADHLSTLRYGRGLASQLNPMKAAELPTERARALQKQFAEEKENSKKLLGQSENKTALEKLWMGDETEGWRERRMEEERKALREGKTYTDIIFGQIWEVWNGDKKKKNGENDRGKKE